MKVTVERSTKVTITLTDRQAGWLGALVGNIRDGDTEHGRFLGDLWQALYEKLEEFESKGAVIPRSRDLFAVDAERGVLVAIAKSSPEPAGTVPGV